MKNRTPFPPVFWVANTIEILERFAYYGIYFGFGIYMQHLGYSRDQLGIVQSIFLFISYSIPVISGTFADRYGFKKVLIVSYLAYLPSVLLLLLTKSFSGIALTMLSIGLAAGIFKPLISGTVRAVSDQTNKTLGFGIFYAMVNIGGTFGPIVAGHLRAISWSYAFIAAAIAVVVMLLVTIFFYKEPPREIEGTTLKQKFREMGVALSDAKFATFLVLLGFFWWLPFWSFFNICAVYVDTNLDTARLYLNIKSVLGSGVANFLSHEGEDGVRRILGETIGSTGWIIIFLQVFVSQSIEKWKAMPTFIAGLVISAVGFVIIGIAMVAPPSLALLGIFFFALGEMMASPRIQEYITWIAPKEKAGLYMGTNFLAVCIGGLTSGLYTGLYGRVSDAGHADYVWYIMAAHFVLAIIVISLFMRVAGEFKEQEA
ncbi:MAG: MFS transporter [Candidatus Krumholzibacteria bacterium]|nr:MFS transporter [Candidatus Krumholzibacteria bacterium]MDH4338202.1 MFS transporter [Candidatus Krumholzibacteria bacterium]MDH5270877.1 MFS transporter [Candidatus Krumholzibacteria bacterium]